MTQDLKLYEITVEMTLYVVAENEEEAKSLGAEHYPKESPDMLDARLVQYAVSTKWQDCLPYTKKGVPEMTCGEWMAAKQASDS